MPTVIDEYATRVLGKFREAVATGDIHRLTEFRELLDLQVLTVKTLDGLCKRRIRALCSHEESVVLASHCGVVKKLSLAVDANQKDGWRYPVGEDFLPSRCLSCAIGRRQGRVVVLVSLEHGGVHILDFETGKQVGHLPINANLSSLACYPNIESDLSEKFAVCSTGQRKVYVCRTYDSHTKHPRVLAELSFESSPRACFWAQGDTGDPVLFVFDSGGAVRTFACQNGTVDEVDQPTKGDNLVYAGAEAFHAVVLAEKNELESSFLEFLVTSQSPKVATMFSCTMLGPAEERWCHFDDDRCYAAACLRQLDRVILGSRNGDLWVYSRGGYPLSWHRVKAPVRAICSLETKAGNYGFAVAHGMGQVSLYWCPQIDGEEGLLDEVLTRKEFTTVDFSVWHQSAEVLAFLREPETPVSTNHSKPVRGRIPTSLNWRARPEVLPALFSVIDSWVRSYPREIMRLWPVIKSWLQQQVVPTELQRLVENLTDSTARLLPGGIGVQFRNLVSKIQPVDPAPDMPFRVTQAINALMQKNIEKANEWIGPASDFINKNSSATEYWEFIERVPFTSAVEAIVSSTDAVGRATVVVTDGTAFDLKLSDSTKVNWNSDGEVATAEPLVVDGRVADGCSIGLTAQQTVAVFGPGNCTIHNSEKSDVETKPIVNSPITGMAVRGSEQLFGTIDGAIYYRATADAPLKLLYDSGKHGPRTRFRAMVLGRFRHQTETEFVAFRQSGVPIVGQVDGQQVGEVAVSDVNCKLSGYCPAHVSSDDLTGDGLSEVVWVQKNESCVSILSWGDGPYCPRLTQLPLPDVISVTVAPSLDETLPRLIAGTATGKVFEAHWNNPKKAWSSWQIQSIGLGSQSTSVNSDPPQMLRHGLRALGFIRITTGLVLLTANGVHVDLWQAIPRSEIESKRWTSRTDGNYAVINHAQEWIQTTSIRNAGAKLQRLVTSTNRELIVVRSLPGAGKPGVIDSLGDVLTQKLFLVRVPLELKDDRLQYVGRRIAQAIERVYPWGIQAQTWNVAKASGQPGQIHNLLSTLRASLRDSKNDWQRGRIVMHFQSDQLFGPLLEDVVEAGAGSAIYKTLADWAFEFGPEIQFVVLSDHLDHGMVSALEKAMIGCQIVKLSGRLTEDDTNEVLSASFPHPDSTVGRTRQLLIEEGDGNLVVLSALCRRIAEMATKRRLTVVTPEMVAEMSRSLYELRTQLFSRTWSQLSEHQRLAVAVAAHLDRKFEVFDQTDFVAVSAFADRIRHREQLKEDFDQLVNWSVLEHALSRSRFQFVSRRFAEWVRTVEKSLSALVRWRTVRRDEPANMASLPIQLSELTALHEELSKEGQVDEVLGVLKVEHTRWHQLLQISGLYCRAADANYDAAGVLEFLKAFLRWADCGCVEPRSNQEGDVAWTWGSMSPGLSSAAYSVGFLCIAARLLERDRLSRAREEITYARSKLIEDFRVSEDSQGALPLVFCLVCGPCNDDARRLLNELTSVPEILLLNENDIRDIAFSDRPNVTLKLSLKGLKHSTQIPNPYLYEGRVRRRSMAVPRQSVDGSADLAAKISGDFNSYKIVGSRRIGKTTLLHQIQWYLDLEPRHAACICSLDAAQHVRPNEDLEAVCWKHLEIELRHMTQVMRKRESERGLEPTFPALTSIKSADDFAAWHLLLRNSSYQITIMLDEFDPIIRHGGAGRFLGQLRAEMFAPGSKLRIVVAGWSELQVATEEKGNPLVNWGSTQRLKQLDSESAQKLVIDVMDANGFEYADPVNAVRDVAEQASFHPSFLQLFLLHLFDRVLRSGGRITGQLIREIGASPDFRREVKHTVIENFKDWTLLTFTALLLETLRPDRTYRQSGEMAPPFIEQVRTRVATLLDEHGCYERLVDEQQFQRAITLLERATATEQLTRAGRDCLRFTFPRSLTFEDAAELALIACQSIGRLQLTKEPST